jgi:mono/diheme cytochrome c family protein
MEQYQTIIRVQSRYLSVKTTFIRFFVLLTLSACSFSLAEDITPPPGAEIPVEVPTHPSLSGPLYPLVQPDSSAGYPIYIDKCATCHGITGLGDGSMAGQLPVPAPALGADEVASLSSPAEWYAIVTQGNLERRMPPFNSLTDRQRWDVIAYLYSLSSTPEIIAQGESLYQANCVSCHGEQGDGGGPDAAGLSAHPTDFTDQEFMAGISGEHLFQVISDGKSPDMPAFGEKLSPDERWALAAYLRSLTFASKVAVSEIADTPTLSAETTQEPQITAEVTGLGRIEGQVINESGGEIPADLTITLYGFDQMQQTFTAQTTADAEGVYTFEDVEIPEGRAFLTSLEHKGVAYSSDIAVVDPETTNLVLMIPYYEITTDRSNLYVDRLHLLFDYIDPDILRVVEMYIISNPSDRIVVAAKEGEAVITFTLPQGATNLQFQDGAVGERYVEMPNGFGDVAAVRPGASQHQVIYSYDLPYKSKLDFNQPVNLPVNAVVILLPEDGLRVSGDQLQDMGTRDVQGISYRMYSGAKIESGANLRMDISGHPKTGGAGLELGSDTNLVVGISAFGLALILAGGWLYLRTRNGKDGEASPEFDEGYTIDGDEQDVETLFDTILALDDKYQAGELPEEVYTKRRAELKARIKHLLGDKE